MSLRVSLKITSSLGSHVPRSSLYTSIFKARHTGALTFVLNDLFVDEHARRKGVASKLMAAAVDYASTLGAVRVSLSTAITNEVAQTLYQSAGWQRDEQLLVYHFAIPPTLVS
jgi:GNAT superfamily N-acetyltransferase